MDKKLARSYALRYSVSFGFFQILIASVLSYASVYLLNLGFSDAIIGLIIGTANIINTILQPLLGMFIDMKRKMSLQTLMMVTQFAIFIGSLYLLFFGSNNLPSIFIFLLINSVLSSFQTALNSMFFYLESMGMSLNYGLSRGIGSISYAIFSAVMGAMLSKIDHSLMPLFYAVSVLGFLVMTFSLRKVPNVLQEATENGLPMMQFIRKYKKFVVFCLSAGFTLILFYAAGNIFTIQIVTRLGGGTTEMGYAIGIGAGLELPAMFYAGRLAKKIKVHKLLIFSGICFVIKYLLLVIAQDMMMFYVSQLFQLLSFGLFYPTVVLYIGMVLPAQDIGKGQGFFAMVNSASLIVASYLGGFLIDSFSVMVMLVTFTVMAVLGVLVLSRTVENVGTAKD